MKEIKLKVDMAISEVAVEQAMLDMRLHHHKENFALILNTSVFDINTAINMMIDYKTFRHVRYVHITPEFRNGEWSLVDELNGVYVKSGVY